MVLEMMSLNFLKYENNYNNIVLSKIYKRKKMRKSFVLAAVIAMVFGGCSAKEFNEGVDSITSDISNTFEEGKDK